MSTRVAAVALSAEAGVLARRIAGALGDAEVHGLRGRVRDADRSFTETARHLRALFAAGRRMFIGGANPHETRLTHARYVFVVRYLPRQGLTDLD